MRHSIKVEKIRKIAYVLIVKISAQDLGKVASLGFKKVIRFEAVPTRADKMVVFEKAGNLE